ncbi:glycosyltransferase, partial [Bacillus sp. WP8]|uniref:glycosyltransferase n=1 Tax=Bacillus sp. WP8 TaxID=756828 RepID=UPI0037BFC74D
MHALFIATQYHVTSPHHLFHPFHFYHLSHSFQFTHHPYQLPIAKQQQPSSIHKSAHHFHPQPYEKPRQL